MGRVPHPSLAWRPDRTSPGCGMEVCTVPPLKEGTDPWGVAGAPHLLLGHTGTLEEAHQSQAGPVGLPRSAVQAIQVFAAAVAMEAVAVVAAGSCCRCLCSSAASNLRAPVLRRSPELDLEDLQMSPLPSPGLLNLHRQRGL